ncbi:MAG TPA: metallophosphoesterase family protein [Steroidobacteraceae bacterium]|nr:metallophosphoesterase family protein [Steroidobacteraceae bacterium]
MTPTKSISRRDVLRGVGAAWVASPLAHASDPQPIVGDGTPEQVHLTWGPDPAQSVVVSWASPTRSVNPRVKVTPSGAAARLVRGLERAYTDGINGQTVFTYHATVDGLAPQSIYRYTILSDNDRQPTPFTASFQTAPRGRVAFRFTSYGDLSTPQTDWVMSSPQSRRAVDAVERFAPLFHLLNGDLCYANLNPLSQPAVWADYGRNVQRSAAHRPWMPCSGNHEIEFGNGEQGMNSYLTRFSLPDNGTQFAGHWYSFRVGSALFISLAADDVIYQDSGPFVTGPAPLVPVISTGHARIEPGTSFYVRGYSRGAQTRWLRETLRSAKNATGIDWIIVQMHQDALSSSKNGNGSDKGLREEWLPLFDQYGVDLVLCGHDHDYERSWPVRGCNRHVGRDAATGTVVDTLQPRPVLTAEPTSGEFDASSGTIHLILGCGGTASPTDIYGARAGSGVPQAKVITRANRPVPSGTAGIFMKLNADAVEDAIWSARRDAATGYGIAVFDLDPGKPGGKTSITMRYYHALGAEHLPTSDYELFDTMVMAKQRRG